MEWLLSLKVVFTSIGVVSMALALNLSVPLVMEFFRSYLPLFWSCLLSWLKPPYLYVVINCIIISIVASSRFYPKQGDEKVVEEEVPSTERFSSDLGYDQEKISAENPSEFSIVETPAVYEERGEVTVFEVMKDVDYRQVSGYEVAEAEVPEVVDEDKDVISNSALNAPPKRAELSEFSLPAEKPLVSTRFGHRKPVKSSPEGGRKLRVTKPKRNETLENTWKAITEGRSIPLNSRHMKKCDTWENHGRQMSIGDEALLLQLDPNTHMKKSETFQDRTNYQQPSPPAAATPLKLRKEPSLSQDELNRRVEAFITKFNNDMRLQRMESLNQYKEMITKS